MSDPSQPLPPTTPQDLPPTVPQDLPPTATADQRLGQPAPGWWLASDGQWYPPQNQPGYAVQPYGQPYGQPGYGPAVHPEAKSRVIAGVLQLAVGGLGIGRFYLGYTGIGVAQLLVTIFTCGFGVIWTIIDGIMILTGKVPTDARGIPLKD
jgi:TM2 domain-containing membrane protein YozV